MLAYVDPPRDPVYPMTKKPSVLLIAAIVVALLLGLYYAKYYGSYALDTVRRPWAYGSGDELLVGKWRGSFRDPGGVDKQITVEVFVPLTDEERARRAGRMRRSRRSRGNKRTFDGVARLESRFGIEAYEIFGSVDANADRRMKFQFGPEDESKRVLPNYVLAAADEGAWDGKTLTAKLRFSRIDADGVARSSGEMVVVDGKLVDVPKPEDRPIAVTLTRVP